MAYVGADAPPFFVAHGEKDTLVLVGDELNLVFALSHATEIRAVADLGDAALSSELGKWEPYEWAVLARALAEVG